jgi:predicted transcriptional regulator
VLDLPQLELDCMKVLWARGEASVRQVWAELSARRSLAYTTIETILDRLARKGVATRVRNGRAFLYRPHVTLEQARHFALTKLVENFFAGSFRQLAVFLENPAALSVPLGAPAPPPSPVARTPGPSGRPQRRKLPDEVPSAAAPRIDESLL